MYNVGGHNERPNIFIVKTIISQLHDRLQDEGISEALIQHVADRLGHDRRLPASTPPRSRTIWAGIPRHPLKRASC